LLSLGCEVFYEATTNKAHFYPIPIYNLSHVTNFLDFSALIQFYELFRDVMETCKTYQIWHCMPDGPAGRLACVPCWGLEAGNGSGTTKPGWCHAHEHNVGHVCSAGLAHWPGLLNLRQCRNKKIISSFFHAHVHSLPWAMHELLHQRDPNRH
jgi:hypothetical protein